MEGIKNTLSEMQIPVLQPTYVTYAYTTYLNDVVNDSTDISVPSSNNIKMSNQTTYRRCSQSHQVNSWTPSVQLLSIELSTFAISVKRAWISTGSSKSMLKSASKTNYMALWKNYKNVTNLDWFIMISWWQLPVLVSLCSYSVLRRRSYKWNNYSLDCCY
jgi:hypothetical protein